MASTGEAEKSHVSQGVLYTCMVRGLAMESMALAEEKAEHDWCHTQSSHTTRGFCQLLSLKQFCKSGLKK